MRDARQQYAAALDNLCGLLPGFRVSVAADDPLQRGLLLDFLLSRGAQEAPGALDIRLGCDGENFSIRENGRDYSYETLLLLLAADAAGPEFRRCICLPVRPICRWETGI